MNRDDELVVEGARMMARALADFFEHCYKGGKLNVRVMGDDSGTPFKAIKCDPVDVVKATTRLDYFDVFQFIYEVDGALDIDYEFEKKADSKGERKAMFKGFKKPEQAKGSKAFELLCQLLGKEDK